MWRQFLQGVWLWQREVGWLLEEDVMAALSGLSPNREDRLGPLNDYLNFC